MMSPSLIVCTCTGAFKNARRRDMRSTTSTRECRIKKSCTWCFWWRAKPGWLKIHHSRKAHPLQFVGKKECRSSNCCCGADACMQPKVGQVRGNVASEVVLDCCSPATSQQAQKKAAGISS